MITGSAGSGKTTALRRLAYILVEKNLTSSSQSRGSKARVPVLLRAASVAGADNSLLHLCTEETKRLAESNKPAFTADDLREGRVVVLIDSLDELPDDKARSSVLRRVLEFHEEYPECQVILTSRDYSFVGMLSELAPFTRFSLSPISLNQAHQLLEKIERTRQLPVDASREILRRLQQVHGFELNPMLVTVFAATSDFSRKDVPANITELFKKYTETMLGRWSAAKGMGQQFHAPLKDFLLRQVAFEMHRRQVTSLNVEEFKFLVVSSLKARGLEAEIDILLQEVLYHSGLFRLIDNSVEFRHLLLQEFFAGRGIPSNDVLEMVITEEWWQRATIFYFGEHPDDVKGLASARNAVELRTDPERYRAAITLGLALQACYLVEVKDKADVFKWVLQIMARSKKGFIETSIANGAPEIMAFVYYYLFGRDAVACSVSEEIRARLATQLKAESIDEDERDTLQFWQIVSRIETGVEDVVDRLVKQYRPDDPRLLFGIWLSLRFIEELRVSPKDQKVVSARISARLQGRITGVISEFSKEFKSVLLELRRGEIKEILPGQDIEAAERDSG